MDLDQLQSVRDRERQTDRLQQLRDSFYEEAAAFVRELRAERDEAAAAADDPFGAPRVNRLTDRIRTAEQTLEAIYEKRVGKVVKAATFAAADLPAEADGMTKEEAALFDTLVAEIEGNRERVLGRLDVGDESSVDAGDDAGAASASGGETTRTEASTGTKRADADGPPAGTEDSHAVPDSDEESPALGAADAMGGEPRADVDHSEPPGNPSGASQQATDASPTAAVDGPGGADDGSGTPGEAEAPAGGQTADGADPVAANDAVGVEHPAAEEHAAGSDADAADVERVLVRITDDVGPILGVDEREYDLTADDVVMLPAENARPLVDRGVAERLE